MLSIGAAAADNERVSKPGQYNGYSQARFDGYEMTAQYVPVRDGTRLAIDIFRPTASGTTTSEKLPVLWMHTPYNRRNYANGLTVANYPGKALQLVKHGYVVAVADFRGLYASFGKNSGFNRGEWQDAARMDAYDITEWLAKQSWSSGKVGMWGCSATGGSQMQALSTAPPSLKAIFPMSCEWDVYAFVAKGGITPPKGVPTQIMRGASREARDKTAVGVDNDADKQLLTLAIAEHSNNIEGAGFSPYSDSVAENFGNQWWLKSSPHTYESTINHSGIAVYAAANWDEGATGYGAAFIYNNIKNPKKLILGPATHCDWTTVMKDTGFDIVVEELRYFDHWLKGVENNVMREHAVTYYTYNDTAGKEWKTSATWPLSNEKRTAFYLSAGSLGKSKPTDSGRSTKTVDYTITDATFWTDGLMFVTAPLAADTEVTGHSVLSLWLQTTANDSDVIARIDDVAPDGTHRYVSVEGRQRASLRATAKPPYNNLGLPWHPYTLASYQPLQPDKPVQVSFDLFATSYVFKAGHRIRLTMQFADARATPKIEPAPTITIIHSKEMASVLTLPIIPR
jgi:predicted acyl esterase